MQELPEAAMNEQCRALSEHWYRECEARVRTLLRQLLDGDDAPPAQRFKAEGFAEAGLALGLVDPDQLAGLLDALYREYHDASVAQLFPFAATECVDGPAARFTLPLLMRRAPVYPGSTE
jgi:hypothetical protein